LHPDDPYIIAIASDVSVLDAKVPVIDLNNIEAVADLLFKQAVSIDQVTEV
jgi:molybdopterin-guanine dinucleotide biosynthesis protein B